MASRPRLSKSTYMRGLQCPKSLWLYRNRPELQDGISAAQEAVFAQGTNVGRLAWGLFPGGVDLSPEYVDGVPQFAKPLARTREELRGKAKVLYEPALEHDGVFAAVDMMVRTGKRWKAFEVKSGTSVKETYATDAALQHWVLASAGLDVADISIVHIDNSYVRSGEIDVHGLFAIESVLEQARARHDEIGEEIARLKKVLGQKAAPEVPIGPHCSDPYQCSFTGHCWKHVPDGSVFGLGRVGAKAWELYEQGVLRVADIPDDFRLNAAQRIEVEAARTGRPHVNRKGVREFVKALDGPLLFLDFETVGPAVPLFDGTRPYQAIPFDGKVLLENMHALGTRDSLIYWLEFKDDEEFPAKFGSIAGGSALKFGLYRRKETGAWTVGNPREQREISEDEAIVIARRNRDQFLEGVKLLQGMLGCRTRHLAGLMEDGVGTIRLDAETLLRARRRMDRLTAVYEPSLRLIEALVSGSGTTPEGRRSDVPLAGFLFDMNRFFERLLDRFLSENVPDAEVKLQRSLTDMFYWELGEGVARRRPPSPRPDYVVTSRAGRHAVLDAKYRDFGSSSLPREILYQLTMYSLCPEAGGRSAILYPSMNRATDGSLQEEHLHIRDPLTGKQIAKVTLRAVPIPTVADLLVDRPSIAEKRARSSLAQRLAFG